MSTDLNLYSPTGPELRPEWSMRLVMDVALDTTTESILEAHELQYHQFEAICKNPQFVAKVADLRKDLEKEGASFRMKAQIQADFYLAKVHEMIMDPETDERVVTRLIEDTVRWGGLDAPPTVGDGKVGGFSININFGEHARRGITIDGDQ
uniref:Uncharacterized protein n=1 Tax=viral metagenome TaxID=1070528 RepID=A0A6M3X410_9ZZZZ